MKLTFHDGKFIARDVRAEAEAQGKDGESVLLQANPYWARETAGVYSTRDLRAAKEFIWCADAVAVGVFKRAFQEHYSAEHLNYAAYAHLDPHQQAGVLWALSRKRSYLAHAPGAGKTAEAVTVSCLAEGEGQTLILVPPGLERNWEREIWLWTEAFDLFPTIGIVGKSSTQEDMAWRADYIIVPDSMLPKPWVYQRLWGMKKKAVIVDEASRFKEAGALRSRVFYGGRSEVKDEQGRKHWRTYPGLFQEARHVVFLDGSPMPNRPMELWAPAYALCPESIDCMSQQDFGFRFCGPTVNRWGAYEFKHSSNERELNAMLTRDFMHVVTEEELSHPERMRSLLFMNQDVRSPEHRAWEKRHLDEIDFDRLSDDESQGDLAKYRAELGLRKVPWTAAYVRERLTTKNESIIVFAWHREVCLKLASELKQFHPGLVMGGQDRAAREGAIEAFQAGRSRLIIGNHLALGRGYNLQRADRVIFCEASWSDELNKQCEKRASRKGRDVEKPVRCEYVVAPRSMDEPILRALFAKQARVRKVIG